MARASPVIPGLPLTLGYTLFYLSLFILIPLAGLVFKTTQLTWSEFYGDDHRSGGRRGLQAHFRRRGDRCRDQWRFRLDCRLGSCARAVSGRRFSMR